jgi:hypothetical protein
MRDVAFYFRKTGIKSTDFGLADIVLGREDLTIFMVSSTGADRERKGCARSCRGLYSISSVHAIYSDGEDGEIQCINSLSSFLAVLDF